MAGDKRLPIVWFFMLSMVLIFFGCHRDYDFLPKESPYYEIEGDRIIFVNSEVNIGISGGYVVTGRYLATFEIQIMSFSDTVYASFSEVEFVGDSSSRQIRLVAFSRRDIEPDKEEIIPPNIERSMILRLEVPGINPTNPQEAFSEITLILNSVFSIRGEALHLPEFHFIASKE
jgi:hypothetical protein